MSSRAKLVPVALATLFCLISAASALQAATVVTDATDYPPGETVYITGTGFLSFEQVQVQVVHYDGDPIGGEGHDPWIVVADVSGTFYTTWVVPYDDNVGEQLLLTADGLSSAYHAETLFTDANVVLNLTGTVPDSACPGPGQFIEICAELIQDCAGPTDEPLEGRELIFFINPNNCGVDVAQTGEDTVSTDANGIACSNLEVPTTPGNYKIRVKFLGEDKPNPCPTPGNSACNPNDPNANKRCVALSNSNVCEDLVVDSAACDPCLTNTAPVAFAGNDSTLFQCDLSEICIDASCTDIDGNLESCTLVSGPGSYDGSQICFTPAAAGSYTFVLEAVDSCGAMDYDTSVVTVTLNSPPIAVCANDSSIFVCDLSDITINGFSASDPDGNLVSTVVNGGSLSGNQVTFTPVEGLNVLQLIATDACGAADTCQTTVTVDLNSPPVASCHNDTTIFVCDLSDITLGGFTASDPDGNLVSTVVNGGTLVGSDVTFTPVVGANVIQLIATDACGEADTCETTVTIETNNPPVATCPGNSSLFVCDLSDITIGGFSATDPDGNLVSTTVTGGTLNGSDVTFTPVVGANVIQLIATDACGEADTCQTTVTVALNSPPVVNCPGNSTIFVCDLSEICIPGFSYSDPDNNIETVTVTGGTLNGNEVCFTPQAGANVITLTAVDSCGVQASCQTTITVVLNGPPVVGCPGDSTIFACDQSQICIPGFSYSDPDNNIETVTVTGGTLNGNEVCFTPQAGANVITLTATDSCGVQASCQTTITVDLNSPPQVTCPGDSTIFACDLSQICIPGFSYSDPDNNIETVTVTGGTLNGNEVCFTPQAGANVITLTAIDSCGVQASCQTTITVVLNSPPQVTCPGDSTIFACDLSQICIPGFSYSDPDNNIETVTVTGGTLNGNEVCFTPQAGANVITLTATDSCGVQASCQTTITVDLNSPPQVTCPGDSTIFACDLSQICIPGFSYSDPDNNIETVTVTGGTLNGNEVCFTPQAGANVITLTAIDSCGVQASCQTTITVVLNSPPQVTCPGDSTIFACDLSQICIPGFSYSDPDNNIETVTVTGGTLNGNEVCFTPQAGANVITLTAVDSCGVQASCQTTITVVLNSPPVVNCPGDSTIFACDLSQICIPGFSYSDPDNNIETVSVTGGTLNGNEVCFTPQVGVNVITLTATDSCGVQASCQTTITVDLNSPPVADAGADQTITCFTSGEVCWSASCSDPDGNLSSCSLVSGPGTYSGGQICFTPGSGGVFDFVLEAVDSCGATDYDTVTVTVQEIVVRTEKTHNAIQGHYENVSVTIEGVGTEFGGFSFLFVYDNSALSFVEAIPGDLYTTCGWEYFTYRYGIVGSCDGPCPSGLVRVVGVADLNNGPNHPSCFGPALPVATEMFVLRFLVTNDRNYECQYVPIGFYWADCSDNAISSVTGDTLWLEKRILSFDGNVIWDEFDDIGYPDGDRPVGVGAPDYCLLGDKYEPCRFIEFHEGGVDIVCADSIDDRGDMNLNGISHEIADAVLYTNYFLYGLDALDPDPQRLQAQIAASDINADGTPLSVGDLVYILRVITGDALPFAKLSPFSATATLIHNGSKLISESAVELGALYLTFTAGSSYTIENLSDLDMELVERDGNVYVLIYDLDRNAVTAGTNELLLIDGQVELVQAEVADYYGNLVNTDLKKSILPTEFGLSQNYPNPFNPTTMIEFALPEQSSVSLKIFNATGQTVRTVLSKDFNAGLHQISWDGRDDSGNDVASGIYFYRLEAAGFVATRKMMMLK